MREFVLVTVFGLVFLAVILCGGGKDAEGSSCQQTVESSCTRCHSTERICRELGHAGADWPAIVKNMGKRGRLNQELQDKVLACLTSTTESGGFACSK